MSEQDDPIVSSVSSGYDNDPLAFHTTRSGRTIWMYPEARARFEERNPEAAEASRRWDRAREAFRKAWEVPTDDAQR